MIDTALNFLIDVVVGVVAGALGLLPQSPFQFPVMDWGPFGMLIGTFIPVDTLFLHMTAITSAMLTYYAIRWLLRTIRMIQ